MLTIAAALLVAGTADAAALDAAFSEFWAAANPKAAQRAAERIVRLQPDFDEAWKRVAAGRAYSKGAPTGEIRWTSGVVADSPLATTVIVPQDYDPQRKYAVRVFLHGGVARPAPEEQQQRPQANPRRRRLESDIPLLYVYPSGFAEAQWWFANQVDSIVATLDHLKRAYNVDENRVHLMGVSDGGTGVYFFGLREATPWSVLFPFNGFLRVLTNPVVGADGEFFMANLTNKPLYVVNGGHDPLYPAAAVIPWVALLQRAGAPLVYRPQPAAGHDTSWWPTERALVDAFEQKHPRDPLPDRLSWQTERTDRYNRLHWLVIEKLDSSRSTSAFEELNEVERPQVVEFGLRVDARRDNGRRVTEALPGTAASRMGLRKDDLLISIDTLEIGSSDDIRRAFDAHAAGTPLVFTIERRSERLTLSAAPPTPPPAEHEEAFHHARPSGRVDLTRDGNGVVARTRGVGAFTLLLSPDRFDFSQPIRVVVNGKPAFDGRVQRDLGTLLKWAARDNDRTMLFAAELRVEVPGRDAR